MENANTEYAGRLTDGSHEVVMHILSSIQQKPHIAERLGIGVQNQIVCARIQLDPRHSGK